MKVVSEALTFFVSFFVLRQKMKSFRDTYWEGMRTSSAQAVPMAIVEGFYFFMA